MAGQGYSHVTDKGFVAFSDELDKGGWTDISVATYDQPDSMTKAPLAKAPVGTCWKLRLTWSIRALIAAGGSDVFAERDAEWDSSQRSFHLGLAVAAEARDPLVRAAADRLRESLMSGGGTQQTLLSYDQEVDFGRNQLKKAEQPNVAADIAMVGAQGYLTRIQEATNALATAIGRDSGKGRAPARGRRLREALVMCSGAFNAVHDEILWAIEHTADKEDLEFLESLLTPMKQLLDRYPASAANNADEPEAPAPENP